MRCDDVWLLLLLTTMRGALQQVICDVCDVWFVFVCIFYASNAACELSGRREL